MLCFVAIPDISKTDMSSAIRDISTHEEIISFIRSQLQVTKATVRDCVNSLSTVCLHEIATDDIVCCLMVRVCRVPYLVQKDKPEKKNAILIECLVRLEHCEGSGYVTHLMELLRWHYPSSPLITQVVNTAMKYYLKLAFNRIPK